MNSLTNLIVCVGYFVCIGIDITLFFLIVRLILLRKHVSWLAPFDQAGQAIVGAVIARIPNIFSTKQSLSEKGRLIAAWAVLTLLRGIITMALSR